MMMRSRKPAWFVVGCLFGACIAFDAWAQTVNDTNARIARLQAQILQLEEQIRRLTGRLEESEFGHSQTRARLDRLIQDIDQRLQAIEGASQSSVQSGNVVPLPSEGQTTADDLTAAAPDRSAGPVPSADERPGVLGTIPRNALLGIETPQDLPEGQSPPIRGDAATRFLAIQELLGGSDISSSRPALQAFLRDFPEAGQAPEASFLLGETLFLDEMYAEAAAQFAQNYRTFGADDTRAADNLLKLGMSLARLGDADRACTAFGQFTQRYPAANPALRQMAGRESEAASCP